MIEPGSQLPDATVFSTARTPLSLASLSREGTTLFLFYLFDWSGT